MKVKLLAAAALALLVAAVEARAGDIVDAAWVDAALKRGAIVWDVRGAADYAEGHVPGAVNIGNIGSVLRSANDEDFLPVADIQKQLNAAGIDLRKEIVVYSRKGDVFAHFGLTTVRHFGGKNGKVFHGGLDDWKAAGFKVATEPTRLAATDQLLKVEPGVQLYMPDVLARVGKADVQLIDARTPKEYSGDDIRALRGGHIPGAVNIPYEQNWVDPAAAARLARKEVGTRDGMALKSEAELRRMYAAFDPAKETVVYCQSGVRASETANVLRDLGFSKVRVFEESWLGYGNSLGAPAEDVKFVNVGALKSQIGNLEADVAALHAEIESLKAARR